MLSRAGKGLSNNNPIKESPERVNKSISKLRDQYVKDRSKDVDLNIDQLFESKDNRDDGHKNTLNLIEK